MHAKIEILIRRYGVATVYADWKKMMNLNLPVEANDFVKALAA